MALPSAASGRADAVQLELLRRAGPARRFALARSLSASVIELSRHAIRERNPELSEQEVGLRFVALHYGEDLAAKVRAYLERRR